MRPIAPLQAGVLRRRTKENEVNMNSSEKILDFAIGKEEEAAAFYRDLAAKMDRPLMREVFESFAEEEMGHKAKLEAVKEGHKLVLSEQKTTDLKIGDHLIEPEPGDINTYQDALIVAMRAEKAAFKLYTDLAEAADDANIKELFLTLAQEEAKHKLRFEVEYDDMVFEEN
jgi:rubrerythrin